MTIEEMVRYVRQMKSGVGQSFVITGVESPEVRSALMKAFANDRRVNWTVVKVTGGDIQVIQVRVDRR